GSQAFDEWYRPYAEKEMGDVYFCLAHLHDPGTLHGTKGPLQTPEDLRGKNIRPAHATMARLVNNLGGTSVQVPAGEQRELISKGAAEITASPWDSLFIFGVQDMFTHHLDIPFYVTTFAFVMNKAKLDGLSPDVRKGIDDHCNSERAGKMASAWAAGEAAGRAKRDGLDNQPFYKPTEDNMAQWKGAPAFLQGGRSTAAEPKGEDPEAGWS